MVFSVVLKLDGIALDDRHAHEGFPLQEVTDRECFATDLITHIREVPVDLRGQGVGILGWKQGTRWHPGVGMPKGDAAICGGVEQNIGIKVA